jgi:SAM-dependent methyltransferase/acyl carrier protein
MDPILVETANRMLAASGLVDCKVLQGTAETPGLPDSAFDFIVLRLVLEHVPDPVVALRELSRLLKPGGRLVVIDNDFEYHLRTSPPVPELETLYVAYRASRRKDGGDPCIGRRLPQLLSRAGMSVVGFEVEVSHNAVIGDAPFLKAEGAGIPAKLVSSGFLDEKVLDALTRNWLSMLAAPDHAIMRQLYVAVGERSVVAEKKASDDEAAASKSVAASAGGAASSAAGAGSAAAGSLDLLLELLPEALEKGPVSAGDSLPDLGMDSLSAMNLQDLIRDRTGLEIPIVKILMDVTVEGLAAILDEELARRDGQAGAGGNPAPGRQAAQVEEEI